MPRRHSQFAAALAYRATEEAVRASGYAARLGRARLLGKGLANAAYLIEADMRSPDGSGLCEDLVARVPHRRMTTGEQSASRREVLLLALLGREGLPFRIPEVLGLIEIEGRLVMVQRACHGITLEPRAQPRDLEKPWTIIGTAAAAIHQVRIDAWGTDVLDPVRTRGEHVRAWREEVARDAPAEFDEALAFVDDHLPGDEPGVLLHGDLLPQNLRVDLFDGHPPAVLDWTGATRGDPAYDLAIVTRGIRRPFGIDTGAERLLEAYNASTGQQVELVEVRVHELLLRMGYHTQLTEGTSSACAQAQEVSIVQGLLRRARHADTGPPSSP